MLDDKRRDAQSDVGSEAVGAIATQAKSMGKYEAMLKILCRDDTLRQSYVRRRWQGMAGHPR